MSFIFECPFRNVGQLSCIFRKRRIERANVSRRNRRQPCGSVGDASRHLHSPAVQASALLSRADRSWSRFSCRASVCRESQFLRAINPELVPCALYISLIYTSSVFTCASLVTLVLISLDRYAALFLHLNYQQRATTTRVRAVLAFMWFDSLLLLWDGKIFDSIAFTGALVALLVISVAYIKIYRRLRAQQIQPQAPDQAQQQAGNTLNMARYRRTASTMMTVHVLLLICYLPFSCMTALRSMTKRTALNRSFYEYSY